MEKNKISSFSHDREQMKKWKIIVMIMSSRRYLIKSYHENASKREIL